jgi:hypothetical protein
MKLFDLFRSKMSGQSREEFGFGQRYALSKSMIHSIKQHTSGLREKDLSSYTFERRRSAYGDSKSDLVVYDGEGKPVLMGRESGGPLSFWTYSAEG